MITSSKYTATNFPKYSCRMRFINRWKVPGAYDNPKGMTNHSYNPKGVMNAVFSTSSSFMATCQYPLARSKVVNQLALLKEIGERRVGKECRSRWSPYH